MVILVFNHGLELPAVDAHLFKFLLTFVEAFRNDFLEISDLAIVDPAALVQEIFKVLYLASDLVLREDEGGAFLANICHLLVNLLYLES